MNSENFVIELPKDTWVELPQKHFQLATDGRAATQRTGLKLRRDADALTVAFDCQDDPLWRQTNRRGHNTDLWQQEVFELFIAPGERTPTYYLELELNPNDALFVGQIHNQAKDCGNLELTMIPYETSGVTHRITASGADFWGGEFSVPFVLLGEPTDTYRLNFYRIILTESQTDPNWENDAAYVSYQCWSSTLSGDSPCFHRPDSFGTLRLV